MAEKTNNAESSFRSGANDETKRNATEAGRIKEIIERVKQEQNSAGARKSQRERLLSETEEQTRRRIETARATMEESL